MHPLQEKLLELIGERNVGALSLREIGKAIGETLPQKVKHHLDQLTLKGFISVDPRNQKISRLRNSTHSKDFLVSIPIIGAANCGPANLYADGNIDGYLKISKRLLPKVKGIFAIRAQGNSLNRAQINGKALEHGDFAIIDSSQLTPKDGDYILSVIDNMANMKKYKRDIPNERIVLLSESTQTINPIFIHEQDDFRINGKVIDVVKRYED